MTSLSVNVNKIATLRNSRGGDTPNVLQVSWDILKFGAHGITVHPRPDGRHIRHTDVHELSKLVLDWNAQNPKSPVEFNIEGYPDERFLQLLSEVRFDQATLVPDPPEVLTSNAGWNLSENRIFLTQVTQQIQEKYKARVSLFIDVYAWSDTEAEALSHIKPDRVELFTESYAKNFGTPHESSTLATYKKVAEQVSKLGFGINAGHDLDHKNLGALAHAIPELAEVSIGHALISSALYWGLDKTVKTYLAALQQRTL